MKTVSFVRVIGVDPTLSIIFSPSSPFLPSFFLPLWKTCSSNFVLRVCSPGERGGEGKKRDRKERTNKPANIVQKFPHPFPRKMAVAHFKFSPRNFGFVSSLRVWIPSLFLSVSILLLADISFPTIFPHYPPNLLSIRAKKTNEATRRRFATRQRILLRYFAGTSGKSLFRFLSIPIKLDSNRRDSRGVEIFKKKRKGCTKAKSAGTE